MGKSKMPILIALCVLLMVFMTGCFLSRRDSLADSSTGHKGRDTVEASVTTKSPSDADTSGKPRANPAVIHIFLPLMNMMIMIKIMKRVK